MYLIHLKEKGKDLLQKMKKKLFIIGILLLSMSTIRTEKYALIIAIGDYPVKGGWPSLSSQNDIIHINSALLLMGFNAQNIMTVTDAEATNKGILTSFNALIAKVGKGDFVYIHFSGHGQQVKDDNGDELDDLDEAIVPFDSPLKFVKGVNEGEKLIRDDQLGDLTDKIREKCGTSGQLMLILDSCHSGTGARGMGMARGTGVIMAPDDFVPTLGNADQKMKISKSKSDKLAPMASFFGASARELNYETLDQQSRPVGSLSYAVANVLSGMKNSYTFEDFFDRVKLKMKVYAPRQNPQWEGPDHQKLLGGISIPEQEFFKVLEISGGNMVKAEMGTLTDVFEGTTVEIFSKDKNKVVSQGEVTNAFLSHCMITCNTTLENSKGELLVVRILERAQAPLQIAVKSSLMNGSKWAFIGDHIKKCPMVKDVSANADLYISECKEDLSLQLLTRDGTVLFERKFNPLEKEKNIRDIDGKIRSYMQGKFIRSYENPTSKYNFSLELVPIECNTQKVLNLNKAGDMVVKLGSCVKFKITNTGVSGAYFSLIDIQPDNVLNVVIPAINLGYTAEEYYLKAGESYTTDYHIKISEPLGDETLKLVTSKTPQDLSGIISTEGKSKRGFKSLDSFEKMLSISYDLTHGTPTNQRKPIGEEIGTNTLYFKIVN